MASATRSTSCAAPASTGTTSTQIARIIAAKPSGRGVSPVVGDPETDARQIPGKSRSRQVIATRAPGILENLATCHHADPVRLEEGAGADLCRSAVSAPVRHRDKTARPRNTGRLLDRTARGDRPDRFARSHPRAITPDFPSALWSEPITMSVYSVRTVPKRPKGAQAHIAIPVAPARIELRRGEIAEKAAKSIEL